MNSTPVELETDTGRKSVSPAHESRIRARAGLRCLVVIGLTLLIVLSCLMFGGTWLQYRFAHIVVSDATVKGRVHRVGARIDAQVKAIDVEPAERVSKGDILIRLEDSHIQAALRRAESELSSAQKRYIAEDLSIKHDRQRLQAEVERSVNAASAMTAELEATASEKSRWDREYQRAANLIASGITSSAESDTVRTERDRAAARVQAAQGRKAVAESDSQVARLQVTGLAVRESALEVLQSDIERARQQVALAQADLDATVIRAPDDGWVAERLVEPGGSAKVGEPILSLWIGAPWIEAWVNEKLISRVQVGSPVDVSLPAFPGHRLQGEVESFGVLADKELHTAPVPSSLRSLLAKDSMVAVRIRIQADQLRLQPGLSALIGIQDGTPGMRSALARRTGALLAALTRMIPFHSEPNEP